VFFVPSFPSLLLVFLRVFLRHGLCGSRLGLGSALKGKRQTEKDEWDISCNLHSFAIRQMKALDLAMWHKLWLSRKSARSSGVCCRFLPFFLVIEDKEDVGIVATECMEGSSRPQLSCMPS
jgi:hypothetical protein